MSDNGFIAVSSRIGDALANGLVERWRFVLLSLLLAIGAILAFFGWDVGARLLGVWILLTTSILLVVMVVFDFCKDLIGQPEAQKPGARSASVALALLLAALASPEAISATAKTMAASVYTATVITPQIGAAASNAVDTVPRNAAERRSLVNIEGNKANARLFDELSAQIYKATLNTKADSAAWIWFFFVFSTVLLLARALVQSYDAMLDDGAEVLGDQASPTPRRQSLMNYPKWLALCLYVAILVPATYFSLGALLKLGLDSKGTEISAVQALLRQAGNEAMEATPGSQVSLDDVAKKLQTVRLSLTAPPSGEAGSRPSFPSDYATTLTSAENALTSARAAALALETWRAGYEAAAVRQAGSFKRIATADQFSDQVSALSAQYRAEILKARSHIRACFIGAMDLNNSLGDKTTGVIQASLAASVEIRCNKAVNTLQALPTLPLPVVCSETCANAPKAAAKDDPGCLSCQGGEISDVLYGWMADLSDSAVLIVGLIGFGLFGAAIRMLGRPDETPVAEADFVLARLNREIAHARLLEKGEQRLSAEKVYTDANKAVDQTNPTAVTALNAMRVAFEQIQAEEAEAKKVAIDADNALAALERRASEARTNFVVERIENGKREYVVSGAPAKVLVSGLGAAFTVFLAGKAGVQIFTEGGRTSPTGLLLACFVGAVFAEQIWRAASDMVNKRTTPAG
ncbi:hypothetical protein [Caulobacter sp. RHG1]|uniref:hypothetical protein n=1 Tax=Caulobacter sp. (strain RHG1) TaxID=2545762 RepID=UPI001551B29B|nr:hypothetical protein [Caulobacter sp. RHG1]NQE60406.1 hypothetical protein [Caulobacter sp. RHG1]